MPSLICVCPIAAFHRAALPNTSRNFAFWLPSLTVNSFGFSFSFISTASDHGISHSIDSRFSSKQMSRGRDVKTSWRRFSLKTWRRPRSSRLTRPVTTTSSCGLRNFLKRRRIVITSWKRSFIAAACAVACASSVAFIIFTQNLRAR